MWNDLMQENSSGKFKKIFPLVMIVLLLVLIPLGVYLTRQTQIFKPKATVDQVDPENSFTLSSLWSNCQAGFGGVCNQIDLAPLAPGSEFEAKLIMRSDFDLSNSFSALINFPKDQLEVIGIDASPVSNTCGGIANLQCPQGYSCQLEGPLGQPDRAGSCVLNVGNESPSPSTSASPDSSSPPICGGIQGLVCSAGLECDHSASGTGADATGVCVVPQPKSQTCSGTSDNSCPATYSCVQDCGPVQTNPNSPEPATYSCLSPEQASSRQRFGCPICLSKGTLIETPDGDIKVEDLKEGMKVYSLDNSFKRVTANIIKVSKTPVPLTHKVVHLVLEDGREVWVSPNHPTVNNNQTVGELRKGDLYDNSPVKKTELTGYKAGFTYDLLPDTTTGFYYANGILMGSTLKGSVQGVSVVNAQAVSSAPAYFITQWTAKTFDNSAGTITLSGTADPAIKTQRPDPGKLMATIRFRVKAAGSGTISFGNSRMLRVSDGMDILQIKRNLDFAVTGVSASVTPCPFTAQNPCGSSSPSVTPCPYSTQNPCAPSPSGDFISCSDNSQCSQGKYCQFVKPDGADTTQSGYCINSNGGKGDANKDGFIDLADLSILYSSFLTNKTELDFNNDGIINSIDYANMLLLLKSLKAIR